VSAGWKQRPEGGGWFAIWLIRSIGRYGGRPIARALLYPITLYFLLRRGPERRASRTWLSVATGRRAGWMDVARHIHAFASTILDRVFLLSGEMRRFAIRVLGVEPLHAHLDAGRGVLLFGSHLGSFEVLRVLARERPQARLRVVLDQGHNPAMTQLLDALNPEIAANVIDAAQDGPALMLQIHDAIAAGEMVALLVDRAQPGEPTLAVPFFGRQAPLPLAPWQLAMVLGAPVVLAFGLYRGGNRYDLVFESFSDGEAVPRPARAARIAALIAGYAARLEHHARSAPYNWFNFYDYWTDTPGAEARPGAAGAVAGDAGGGPGGRAAARRA
jgi:predicted LPLAT superfamily acyltransferase